MSTNRYSLVAPQSRRSFLNMALATTLSALSGASFAAEKFVFGEDELISLSDGVWTFPNRFWVGASKPEQMRLGSMVPFGSNAYLIRRGSRTFMVDAGAGNADFITSQFTTVGKLPMELSGIDVAPEDITDIVITHMHPDHFGGVVWNGASLFPNATIHIDRIEWEFWTRDGFATDAPEQMRPMVSMVQANAAIIKDQLQLHTGGDDLGRGIQTVAAYGHTPGHNSFLLELENEQLLVLGDTAFSNHIHFANPDVGWLLDSDPEGAKATRKRLFDMAATDELLVAGNHLDAPGIGRIVRDKGNYAFIPL